jgi:large subunit ribosomal protein L16
VDQIFPDKPVTKSPLKPAWFRQGFSRILGGGGQARRVLFEIKGRARSDASEALRLASHKLPLKTKIIQRTARGAD